MDVADHVESLRSDGLMLVDAAIRAGLDASVPSCPEWVVGDVVRHQGGVHRWAAAHLERGSAEPMDDVEEKTVYESWPDDDGVLLDWFRDGHAALIRVIEAANDDTVAWTFLQAPTPRAFWARRQAFETAIHRADVELASGPVTPYRPELAADGIDEMLRGFALRSKRLTADPPRRLLVAPTDVPRSWLLEIGQRGAAVLDGGADCTLRGSASDLFLLLWNRRTADGLDVSGDATLPDVWRESLRIRWS
jgi:uncharacterized protein (TIGR03083 family)